jgi:hypothetical protein
MPGKMARSGPQRQLDGLEYRELAGPSVLCLPAIQKIPNFHVSSGFIWGIPAKVFTIVELTEALERRFNTDVCIEVIENRPSDMPFQNS